MPASPPVAAADRTTLLGRVNLVRATMGNRTGFEALLGDIDAYLGKRAQGAGSSSQRPK